MLYAKVIYTGVADYTSATDKHTVICADRFDFEVDKGQALMFIYRGDRVDRMQLQGDVWVMNENGKTISQFAVPFSHLQKNEAGEADAHVALTTEGVAARRHQ